MGGELSVAAPTRDSKTRNEEDSMRPIVVSAFVLAMAVTAAAQIQVNLNTWGQRGPSGAGNWTVQGGGSSVFQSINGDPTFFVSPFSQINTTIQGRFRVQESGGDDDFIGFVFGFQSPQGTGTDYDFLLFDWKQGNQSGASEGFSLCRAQGTFNSSQISDGFWRHIDTGPNPSSGPVFDVYQTLFGGQYGWADNTFYTFTLLYEDQRIRIDIEGGSGIYANGMTIFDIAPTDVGFGPSDTFPTGRFGFYNYSQRRVFYESFNTDPQVVEDMRLDPTSFTASTTAPISGQPVSIAIDAINAALNSAMARVDLIEQTPGGPQVVDSRNLTLNPYNGTARANLTWTPSSPGSKVLRCELVNLSYPDGDLSNNSFSFNAFVDAPTDRLSVEGGEVNGWPGASLDVPLTIRNTGNAPTTIAALSIPSGWVSQIPALVGETLQPGEARNALVRVDVPLNAIGAAQVPIPYQLAVIATTTLGNSFAGELHVDLYDAPPSTVTVRVLDDTNLAPLANAAVAIEGIPTSFITDGNGEVMINLSPGTFGFATYKQGYIADATVAAISAANELVEFRLVPGNTLQVSSVAVTQLTTAQAIAQGVDPTVAQNNQITNFTVSLAIGQTVTLPHVPIPITPTVGTPVVIPPTPCLCGGSGPLGTATIGGVINYPAPNVETQTFIIIPGQVWALKQFFDATVVVRNAATAPQIELQNTDVTFGTLPNGLALPDLDGAPQPMIKSLPTIPAGGIDQATWVLRGDAPGTYSVTATAVADVVSNFGMSSNLLGTISDSLSSADFEVFLPKLRLDFLTPGSVVAGSDFIFSVLVTNEQVVDAQLVRVRLNIQDLFNCILCPLIDQPDPTATLLTGGGGEVLWVEITLGDIAPGASKQADFCLTSLVTGDVLSVSSTTTTSNLPSPPVTVSPNYPGIGDLRIRSGANGMVDLNVVKTLSPGETLTMRFDSPNGTLEFLPFMPFAAFTGGAPIEALPGIWLGGAIVQLAGAFVPLYPVVGNTLNFPIPVIFGGLDFYVQGLVLDGATVWSSDAHQIRISN